MFHPDCSLLQKHTIYISNPPITIPGDKIKSLKTLAISFMHLTYFMA